MRVVRSDVDWTQAACIGEPLELFFAECPELVEQARAVCHRCPIVDACADWALSVPEEWGVFGALTPKERYAIRRKQRTKGAA